jgi:hypothetical protein
LFVSTSAHMPLGILGALPVKFFILTKFSTKTNLKLSTIFGSYDKKLFPCYDSFACLDSETQALADNATRALPLTLPRISHFAWAVLQVKHFLRFLSPKTSP